MGLLTILFLIAHANAGAPEAPPTQPVELELHSYDEAIQFFKKMSSLSADDQCKLTYLEFRRDLFPSREKMFSLNKGYSPAEIAQGGAERGWRDVFQAAFAVGPAPVNPGQLETLKKWAARQKEFERCPPPWGANYDIVPWIQFQTGRREPAKKFYFSQLQKGMRDYDKEKNDGVALAEFAMTFLRKLMPGAELKQYEDWLKPRIAERNQRSEGERLEFEQLQKAQMEKAKHDDDEYEKKYGHRPAHP